MASITKRGSSYQVEIRRKDAPKVSKCFKTLTDAKAWARQVEADIDRGNSPLAKVRGAVVPKLAEALTRYDREIASYKKSAVQEQSVIRQWQQSTLGVRQLSTITAKDVATHRDDLLQEGQAPSTVARKLAVLSHVFTMAIKEWGFALDNPVLMIRKPKVANARSRRPTAEEIEAILNHIASHEIKVFVQLAAETAMRRSELHGLSWDRVDLGKRHVYLPDTKNGESRTVVISNKAVNLFQSLPGERSGAVFSFTHKDTPTKAFIRALKAARWKYEGQCKANGEEPRQSYLQDLRLHDMRHEATSSFFERGLSSMEVASLTGHKTLSMLHRYTHLNNRLLAEKLG